MKQTYPRTLQIVQHLAPGGIESIALDFLDHSENCFVLSLEGTRSESMAHWPRLARYDAKINFADKKSGLDFGLPGRIVRLIKSLDIEVVHTHHIGPMLYGGLAARLAGVKCSLHTHHDSWHLADDKASRLTRLANRFLGPINVANAKGVAGEVERRAKCDVRTIYNGIDTHRFRPADREDSLARFELDPSKTWVGCAGRLTQVKGQDLLLEAFVNLPDHVHLAIAGAGEQSDALKQLTEQLGIKDRVRFLGLVEDMPAFYSAMDLYCMPSRNEGFPLAPLEAQACGTPCVVTHVGSSIEAICPESGLAVEANSPDALHDGLAKQLDQLEQLHRPRHFVMKDKDVRSMVDAYSTLASSILATRGAA